MPSPLPAADPGRLEGFFDRNTTGPGIWKWRHYFPIYERHFGRFVGNGPQVMEIGVYSGGSLRMWRDYFGPGARIYGLDIEPACLAYEESGTTVFIGDQADRSFLRKLVAETPDGFDIVIDDGGHHAYQQIAAFEELFPYLRPGGVYLCEDIHRSTHHFWDYLSGLSGQLHEMAERSYDFPANPVQTTVASVTTYPFVAVVEKRSSGLDRLEAPKHGTEWL
jgi:SAM-dependent methyltransferase